MRQLLVFWQFDGDNSSWCNQTCPYCYGGKKQMTHYWNKNIAKWQTAFERLNRDIYFVFSYGESMGMNGFYAAVEMIGQHPTWTLCIVTNNSFNPQRLIESKLAKEKRLFINACWHPLGVKNRLEAWDKFKTHVLMLKNAGVPLHVLYLWYKPQIKWFPEMFDWLDSHDIRVSVRRYVGNIGGFKLPVERAWKHLHLPLTVGGQNYPACHTEPEKHYLYSSTCSKVIAYGINCVSPKGKLCTAGKDMILVKHDGTVGLCADKYSYRLGNIFDANFKLNDKPLRCPSTGCGGDYGMLHLQDNVYGDLPQKLWNDTFVSQVENIHQCSPVLYPNRAEMMRALEELKRENLQY